MGGGESGDCYITGHLDFVTLEYAMVSMLVYSSFVAIPASSWQRYSCLRFDDAMRDRRITGWV